MAPTTLAAYLLQTPPPLPDTTLLFLVQPGEVLLAMKKRGFGTGLWNGVGGKVEPSSHETIEDACVREAKEEIGVAVNAVNLQPRGTLDFYFPLQPAHRDWNQRVHVFVTTRWRGQPRETEEMRPAWFRRDSLPFTHMWPDDPFWLPQVLAGQTVTGAFMFDSHNHVLDHKVAFLPL